MQALILAGGFGSRLQSVISDVPKPMAPVAERPFLEHLLDHCLQFGYQEITLSVGYKAELIIQHFGETYKGVKLKYTVEKEALGTGGAIRFALENSNPETVWTILNGDTLFSCNLYELHKFYKEKNAEMSIALKRMQHFDRYGLVCCDEDKRVIAFLEKQYADEGLINAGVYMFKAGLLQQHFENLCKFSFEKDFMEKYLKALNIYGIELSGYFIDIGIPEDYQKANKDLE
jgi:D-glycero-alpha-D-manno-heptose 1-phosphate guanylyltransferase